MGSAPEILWQYKVGDQPQNVEPLVDEHGNVYVHCYDKVYSFTASGELRWTHQAQVESGSVWGPYIAGVLIRQDGNIVVLEEGPSTMRVLGSDGTVLSSVAVPALGQGLAPGFFYAPPLEAKDGTVFLSVAHATGNGPDTVAAVHRVSSSGEIVGSTLVGDDLRGLSEGPDGHLNATVLTGDSWAVKRLDAQVDELWSLPLDGPGRSTSVSPAGQLWVTLEAPSTWVMGVSPQGEQLYSFKVWTVLASPPLIDAIGNGFISGVGGVELRSPAGDKQWALVSDDGPDPGKLQIWTTPGLSADGTLVVIDATGVLQGVRDGSVRWTVQLDPGDQTTSYFGSVAIGPDGTIFTGTRSGFIYSLR